MRRQNETAAIDEIARVYDEDFWQGFAAQSRLRNAIGDLLDQAGAIDRRVIERKWVGDDLRCGDHDFSAKTGHKLRGSSKSGRGGACSSEKNENLDATAGRPQTLTLRNLRQMEELHVSRLKPIA
jgi:hypothetical protein